MAFGGSCGPSSPVGSGSGGASTTAAETETTSGHPLGWSCGDGIVVTGEYCFRELRLEGVEVSANALGDLTGDARADVVVQTPNELRSYAVEDDGRIDLLDAWGDGREVLSVVLFVGDFDGDGRGDVVRRDFLELALFAQRADGTMGSTPALASTTDVGFPLGVMDVDRDGSDELLVVRLEDAETLPFFVAGIGYRAGEWMQRGMGFEFYSPSATAFGDINNDGITDPAVIMDPSEAKSPRDYIPEIFDTKSAHLGWAQPDGSGVALGTTLTPGFYASMLEMGDVDGDDFIDVLLAMQESEWIDYDYDEPSPPRIIYWGRGNWEFDGPHDLGEVWGAAIDIEGDGVAELVSLETSDPYEVRVHTNGAFATVLVEGPICWNSKDAVDINADGVLDCVGGRDELKVILSDP